MTPQDILTVLIAGLAFLGYVTCLRWALWPTLLATAGLGALMWWMSPPDGTRYPYWASGAALVLAGLMVRRWMPAGQAPVQKAAPKGARTDIVIDGTNVMFWDGEADLRTLRAVVDQLKAKGRTPFVFLDASSRHHLGDPSLNETGFARALGLRRNRIMVCPAGTEADAFILKFAREERLPIVSNDRFGDRAAQVRGLRLVKGGMAGGKPILQGL